MYRFSFLFAVLFVIAFGIGSCTKCTVCTHPDLITGEEIIEEYCGSGQEVTDFENEWAANYDSLGGYCARN